MSNEKRTPAKLELAARLLYDDRLRDQDIAERLGISRRSLARWKELPSVQNRIESLNNEHREQQKQASLRSLMAQI